MDTVVIAALVTALASIIIAAFSAGWSRKQTTELERLRHQLGMEEKKEERSRTARETLNQYREPLLEAAEQLGHRLDNIQNDNFLVYATEGNRKRDIAILSTLFRVARYFGTLEIIYSEVNFLRFERAAETKDVADSLARIGRTFATDSLDGTRFMIWREEQRGIGELSIHRDQDGVLRCLGFASFADRFPRRDLKFFTGFATDLESADAAASERLTQLRSYLAHLVRQLDYEERFSRSGWIEAAAPISEVKRASEITR